jgi:hypothetical protein
MIFFDSESRTDIDISDEQMQKALNGEKVEKDHELYLISACYSRLDKTGEYKDNWKDYHENQGDNFKDAFWNDVDHFVGKRKRCFMFAHNAGYDVIATGCIPAL